MPRASAQALLLAVLLSGSLAIQASPLGGLGLGVGKDRGPIRGGLEPSQLQQQSRSSLSAREAISIAERRYGGRAVGAKRIQTSSGTAYRVRILQGDGKIKNVVIDR